jgi:hypothetical protein
MATANHLNAANLDTLARLRAGQLQGTTRLDLRHCGLSELPPQLLDLAATLQHLDLSGNALQALPPDFHRLHRLQVLFCSDNPFTELPAVLGGCASLALIGFKANRISHVPASALPPTLRWLILTDNRISELPETLGDCLALQKLMLAGNQLHALPASLARCQRLELLRIAANQFETVQAALPLHLLALPRLAWLAHAGNPFSLALEQAGAPGAAGTPAAAKADSVDIDWSALQLQQQLGEGASGHIHAALWQRDGQPPLPVAVKLFKGAMTSDGLPRSEMAACLAAGAHPHIVGVHGRLAGHPDGTAGLVLHRIPAGGQNLAAPPSLASCSRDVYADGQHFGAAQALAIASGLRSALAHLHQRGLTHGDLYAHNTVVDARGHALLGDFGAASFLPVDDPVRRAGLQQLDRRALAVLADELAQRCDEPAALRALQQVV